MTSPCSIPIGVSPGKMASPTHLATTSPRPTSRRCSPIGCFGMSPASTTSSLRRTRSSYAGPTVGMMTWLPRLRGVISDFFLFYADDDSAA